VIKSRLIAQNPQSAMDYYNANKQHISGDVRLAMEEQINVRLEKNEALQIADKLFQMPPEDRPGELLKIKDADLRDRVRTNLQKNIVSAENARNLQLNDGVCVVLGGCQ